jgi:hypothetical protein
MPAGAIPVPKDASGARTCGEWTFFYEGWKAWDSLPKQIKNNLPEDVTLSPSILVHVAQVATCSPRVIKGSLDVVLLRKFGMTKERMTGQDALFFFQLLLPIVDSKQSGVDQDPRMPYYYLKNKFTNKYPVVDKELDGFYGHPWIPHL